MAGNWTRWPETGQLTSFAKNGIISLVLEVGSRSPYILKFKLEVGTAGNWFIKRLLGSLDRELVTESAEARQEGAFFLQHTVHTTTCIIYGRGVGENPQIKEKDDESINGEVLKTTFARIVASGTLIELETFTLWQKARFC